MKKLLIATAAMAVVAGAQAQSSVSVYGIVDLGVNSIESKVTGALNESYTTTGNGKGSLSTNRIGFKGTEDLGAGQKANFLFEVETDAADGTLTKATRESWVELASQNAGSVRLGRTTGLAHRVVAGNLASGANNAVGALAYYAAPTSGTSASLDATAANRIHGITNSMVFVDRSITYVSPTMSGVTVSGQYAENRNNDTTVADADRISTRGLSVDYAVGNLSLSAVSQNMNTKSAQGTDDLNKLTAFGATYNFGVAKLYALQGKNKSLNGLTEVQSSESKVTTIGAQLPISAKLNAWVEASDGETNTSSTATSYDRKGYQVGARYSLSKRTDLYAIYGQQQATKRSNDYKYELIGMAAGIRHSF